MLLVQIYTSNNKDACVRVCLMCDVSPYRRVLHRVAWWYCWTRTRALVSHFSRTTFAYATPPSSSSPAWPSTLLTAHARRQARHSVSSTSSGTARATGAAAAGMDAGPCRASSRLAAGHDPSQTMQAAALVCCVARSR
jgi:hypothetical protein